MSDNLFVRSVTDPRLTAETFARVETLVERPDRLKSEALAKRGWEVVPVESASHFNEKDAKFLAQAMNRSGCNSCLAVITDDVQTCPVFNVVATRAGLLEFSFKCGAFNAVLLPEENDIFVVLCSVDDYFLVAAPPAFLTDALSENVAEARATFARIVSEGSWPPETRRKLMEVAQMYGGFERKTPG